MNIKETVYDILALIGILLLGAVVALNFISDMSHHSPRKKRLPRCDSYDTLIRTNGFCRFR